MLQRVRGNSPAERASQTIAGNQGKGSLVRATKRLATGEILLERGMKQSIVHVALLVRDYDEAIEFYTKKLNFTLVDDTYQPEQDKRWVVVAPPGSVGTTLLLAKASKPAHESFFGNQSGGRVFLF